MEGRMIGFIVWAIVGCTLIIRGISAYFSKKAVAFWANVKSVPARDIKEYNHALGKLFICYGVIFVILGIPLISIMIEREIVFS